MPTLQDILSTAVTLGKQIIPMIVPGAAVPLALAEKAIGVIQSLKDAGTTSPDANETLDALIARVEEHADRVMNKLGDGPTE